MEINFPKIERKVLKFWKKNKIFEKSIKQRGKARDFIFYEGPPTANAKPGIHHMLSRVYKDIICRYKTMRGFRVLRKAGWDTHGLPVELETEKKLGLKSKKEIEKYGIARFNEQCKKSVWLYQQDWEKLTERIGFWLDMEHPYITYQSGYIETVWWILKQIYQKGLIYQGYKVVPYCPRCQTGLSSHEVALGYKKIKEPAIYVKFPVKSQESKVKSYLLVWTTTPWTLPGNVAVAVNPEFTYVKVEVGEEFLILAKERLRVCGVKGKATQEFKGKELLGLEYEPLFPTNSIDKKAYYVIAGDFVSAEEGTGFVHIAPAFGEEDMEVGKENNLPVLLNIDEEGKFKKGVKNWRGLWVKDADPLIVKNLKGRNLLFKEEIYEHDYPFCWRCDSPLLYYAKQGWFINVRKVKKDLIKNNQKINWIPAHLKEGRFGEWLREIKDWVITRERYWGTPLPIWQCSKCGQREVIGSKKDLLKQKFTTNKYYILRHGQTIYQTKKKKIMYPLLKKDSILLTRAGEKQVEEAAKILKNKKIDLIYASDFPRTRRTAKIVAKTLGVKIIFEKGLRDVNLGIYHGGKKEDFYKKFPRRLDRFYGEKPRGGENWGECRKRIVDCLGKIDKNHQNETILIVGHGDPLWLLEGSMKGRNDQELVDKKIKGGYIQTGEIRKIEFKKVPLDREGRWDFHRPYIDQVEFHCPKCGKEMKRIPEVIDCWFDSGSMPFAQYHYPLENRALIDKKQQFPADYISEAIDQTRGWFYTLLAISTLLDFGAPYKNVISLGHVLDEKGEKMSKSKANVVDPWYIIEKYGADAIRWYFYTVSQPGDSKLFTEKDVDQVLKKFIMTFWNSYRFYQTYKPGHKLQVTSYKSKNILDKWVISRLNGLIGEVSLRLDYYDITGSGRTIENFVINDLSLWYIRRSRRRFQKPETKKELEEASGTLRFVLQILSRLTASFIPFLSEEIHQNLVEAKPQQARRSVHLEDWPKADKKLIDKKLNQKMEKVREIVKLALAERAKAGIKIRQPLPKLEIKEKMDRDMLELIKEEVNVKEITFGKRFKLNTKITPELRKEGIVREVLRYIQDMRKTAKFRPKDRIFIRYSGTGEIDKILSEAKDFILKETKAEDFRAGKRPKQVFDAEKEIKIDQQNLWLGIKKI